MGVEFILLHAPFPLGLAFELFVLLLVHRFFHLCVRFHCRILLHGFQKFFVRLSFQPLQQSFYLFFLTIRFTSIKKTKKALSNQEREIKQCNKSSNWLERCLFSFVLFTRLDKFTDSLSTAVSRFLQACFSFSFR